MTSQVPQSQGFMSDLAGWFGPWVSHKVAVKMSAGVQTPEGLTGAEEFTSMGLCHMPAKLALAGDRRPSLSTTWPSPRGCLSVLMT